MNANDIENSSKKKRREEKKRLRIPLTPKQRRKRAIIIIAAVLTFLVLALTVFPIIGLSVFINRHISYRDVTDPRYPLQDIYTASEFGLDENVLTLKTSDGEELWCSEISPEKPDAIVIFCTGIEQPSITYFYPHAKMMKDENVASFLLEVRAHGRSSGTKMGLGFTEPNDVRAVTEYIGSKEIYRDLPIILWGVSMGGAVVLNSFGEIAEVDACIAMSPYASFEDELDLVMEEYYVPKFLRSFELIFLKTALDINFGKDTVDTLKPKNSIKKADGRPVALIACSGDRSVPHRNTEMLKEACPDAQVWIRNSWEHFIVRDCDFVRVEEDTEYCEFTKNFIAAVIAGYIK